MKWEYLKKIRDLFHVFPILYILLTLSENAVKKERVREGGETTVVVFKISFF